MISAIVVGTLVTCAAAALDRLLAGVRRPARFVWLSAMLVTAAWPGIAMVRAQFTATAGVAAGAPLNERVLRAVAVVAHASESAFHVSLDTILLIGWALVSTVLLARLIVALVRLETHGRSWRSRWIGDVRIRMSRDVGPAVVGLDPMEVVFPEWALALDQPLRELVLQHEQEHRRARDPFLLVASALLRALMPWNLVLWWHARRLRLAIELDCDARVLRAYPNADRYGLLLLAIAQRRSALGAPLTPALSEPVSHLERRITAMRVP